MLELNGPVYSRMDLQFLEAGTQTELETHISPTIEIMFLLSTVTYIHISYLCVPLNSQMLAHANIYSITLYPHSKLFNCPQVKIHMLHASK